MGLIQETLKKLENDSVLKEKVKALYKTSNGRNKVAELLGINYNTAGHIAKGLGVQPSRSERKRIIFLEERYRNPFDGSDFGDYMIGYLIGDGSMIVKGGKVLGVNVSSSDLEHLTKIRDMWDPALVIKGPNKGNYSIDCYDRNISDYLLSIGFVPAKSKVGMTLDKPLNWSIMRGIFDSDGSVFSVNGGLGLRMLWAGNKSYMKDVYKFLNGYNYRIEDRKTFEVCYIGKFDDIISIRTKMYENETIKMKRKYERFYEPIKYRNN